MDALREVDSEVASQRANVPTLIKWVKFINFLNACLIATAGIVRFLLPDLSLQTVVLALYVIAFGLIMICFEFHMHAYEHRVAKYCGFMFFWQGRLMFMLMIGAMCIALGVMGYVAAIFTCCNVLFNLYIMMSNPYYKNVMKKSQALSHKKVHLAGAGSSSSSAKNENIDLGDVNVNVGGMSVPVHVTVPKDVAVATAKGVASGQSAGDAAWEATVAHEKTAADGGGGGGGEWQKLFDDETQTYYYHNSTTGETRWEAP